MIDLSPLTWSIIHGLMEPMWRREMTDHIADGSKKVELLPCPYCGGEAAVYTEDGKLWAIRCMGQSIPSCWTESGLYHSEAEAIAAWNRRTPDWRALAQELATALVAADAKAKDVPGYVSSVTILAVARAMKAGLEV